MNKCKINKYKRKLFKWVSNYKSKIIKLNVYKKIFNKMY